MRTRKTALQGTERRTVAYVRVSTAEQAKEGVSLEAQEARIAAYCAAMGWGVPEVIRDAGESAKSLQRPGMATVLSGVRDGSIGRVIVAKLDRLTRSVGDLLTLVELFAASNATLVSIGETLDTSCAAGRMVVHMIAVVAQWERETIAERTSTALAHKRRQRVAYGPTPFGFARVGKALVPEPREQAALEHALRMDRDGASFREIAAHLTALGVAPHRGKAWHPSSVRAVLRSKMATEAA